MHIDSILHKIYLTGFNTYPAEPEYEGSTLSVIRFWLCGNKAYQLIWSADIHILEWHINIFSTAQLKKAIS